MTKSFSPDFYVTAATVIPVLFLALAVRAPAYQGALHSFWASCYKWFNLIRRRRDSRLWWWGRVVISAIVALILVFLLAFGIAIVAAGGYGELLAVYALYQGQAQTTTTRIVLLATMFLIVLVVAPAVAYLISAFRFDTAEREEQQAWKRFMGIS
jgi:hypothetical protein